MQFIENPGSTDTMTLKTAKAIIGSLGFPSKMPGISYGLPAHKTCPAMQLRIMRDKDTSVCSHCYALKGHYQSQSVQRSQTARYMGTLNPLWTAAMIFTLKNYHTRGIRKNGKLVDTSYFRWHDSGDIYSLAYLSKIVAVCRALPQINFWLPTHEPKIVTAYLESGQTFPANLTVRISADRIRETESHALPTSSSGAASGHLCPATYDPTHENQCKDCRACWNASIKNVDYKLH